MLLPFPGRSMTEAGSTALSRFGVVDEQIYLVTGDDKLLILYTPIILGCERDCAVL